MVRIYIHHTHAVRRGEILDANGKSKRKAWVTDACIVVTICVLLFILPSRFPNYIWRRKGGKQINSLYL